MQENGFTKLRRMLCCIHFHKRIKKWEVWCGAAQDQYLVGEPNFRLDLAFVRLLCIGIVLHGGTDCIEH